jgi:TMEM175 potassium channel family protein
MDAQQERERGLGRLISFSDAIVAIAATLLVLPLADAAADIGDRSVTALLSDNRQALIAFALSFAVILRFWMVHHSMYEHVVDYTHGLILVNSVWLICIVFIPFPTELIGKDSGRVAVGLYIGTMLAATAVGTIGQSILARTPRLLSEPARETLTIAPAVITTVTMVVAFVTAVVFPTIGLWALLLLFPANWVERIQRRRVDRQRTPST